MAVIYLLKERRVIPNWRDYERTLQLGELYQSNKSISPIKLTNNRSVLDWRQIKNIGTAADLLNSSFVSDDYDHPEVKEAIEFTKANQHKSSKSLLDLIEKIEHRNQFENRIEDNSLLETNISTINEFQAFINNESFYRVIRNVKKTTINDIKNPISWVELARLYAMSGHDQKAENAMMSALYLSSNNRYVLRSATRLFIHIEKFEKALYYLRKSESIKTDPWLISAHIATSSIMGRFSPLIKDGQRLIASDNYSHFELTELLSSLATLEFKDGSYKKAKQFFQKSMIHPNDNSLAQLEWVSKNDARFKINPFDYPEVINPFEARALQLYQKGKWKDAFYNSIKWFLDMPYSKRPALLGSYIAGSLLNDKNAAIMLCEVGLKANPFDPNLLNNIVYYSISNSENNNLPEKYLKQILNIDIRTLSNENKIYFQATLGLVALKKGDTESGTNLYKLAIENATRLKNEYLKNLATLNFALQLINYNLPEKDKYLEIVKKMKVMDAHKDLLLLKKRVIVKSETLGQI